MEKEIINAIKYFKLFKYSPTFDEIYCFTKKRISKGKLTAILERMIKKGVITTKKINIVDRKFEERYTLGEYSIYIRNQLSKIKYSREKVKIISKFTWLVSFFPQIKLIGLSGTVSMFNALKNDDIDLFVITSVNRLWTGRMICLFLASILGLRRKRNEKYAKDKICLNLFFDEQNLKVPKIKQNEYVAHEVLQMRPIINKKQIYERFLKNNRWVFEIFPNAKQVYRIEYKGLEGGKMSYILRTFADWIEICLKRVQLYFIKKHQTTEIVTDTQLWFFPEDFEKKISHYYKSK